MPGLAAKREALQRDKSNRHSNLFLALNPTMKQSIANLNRHLATLPPFRFWFSLSAVILMAGLFYLLAEIFLFGASPHDWRGSPGYTAVARNLADHWHYSVDGVYPTAGRPPLYPFLLSLCFRFGGDSWFTLALGFQLLSYTGCGVVTALLAFRLTGDRLACLLVTALYISHLSFGVESMAQRETALFCLLATGCFLLLLTPDRRSKYLLMGVVAGLLHLTRPTGFLLALLLPLFALPPAWRKGWGRCALYLGLALGAFTLTTLPWHLYLARTYGNLELLPSSTSGENLYKGNTPELDGIYPLADLDLFNPFIWEYTSGLDEVKKNRWLIQKGREFMREDPGRTLRRMVVKFWAFYSPVTTPYGYGKLNELDGRIVLADYKFDWLNLIGAPHAVLIYLGSFFLLARWKHLNRSQQKEIIQILAWIVVLTGVHLITFGETRHRLPLDSFFILFTAMAAAPWILDHTHSQELRRQTE